MEVFMEIVFDDEEQDDYETEIIDGSLTFDELLEDEYYNAEFEKRVQQRLDIQKNSHPDVKGGLTTMDGQVQTTPQGETANPVEEQGSIGDPGLSAEQINTMEHPAIEPTDTAQQGKTNETPEPPKEMTAQQFEQYNEALRGISKTAKRGLPDRYNAFEDAEIKATVKATVMKGEKPNVKELAASVVTRLTHKEETTPPPSTETSEATSGSTYIADIGAWGLFLMQVCTIVHAAFSSEREGYARIAHAKNKVVLRRVAFLHEFEEWASAEPAK